MKSDIPSRTTRGASGAEDASAKRAATRWVLGVAASHNGSACLLRDGEIVVAVQEERVTRQKRAFIEGHDDSFAIRYCFDHAGIRPADLAAAVICSPLGKEHTRLERNPFLELERHRVPLYTLPHHLGHAVAAFATSGFTDAAVLVIDGMGSPWADLPPNEREASVGGPSGGRPASGGALASGPSGGRPALVGASALDERMSKLVREHATLYGAKGQSIDVIEKHVGPVGAIVKWFEDNPDSGVPPYESLGGIFNSVAVQLFGQFHEAGKVMGLAPFGKALLPTTDFFEIGPSGEFRFTPVALEHARAFPPEVLAASAQAAIEDGILHLVRRLRCKSTSANLVYAGGVALNSITNERIIREGGFDAVYIMPAAEDSGTAIGAAYYGAWKLGGEYPPRRLERDAVGRPYDLADIEQAIARTPAVVRDAARNVVDWLADGKIVGWFEGGSELGPRALGQRSLLCDPRPEGMKDHLNAKVKHREAFRPFAPIVLREEATTWFDLEEAHAESPFMLRIGVREEKRHLVPAVVHVDGSARIQTITPRTHPILHSLVRAFQARTGVPILLNTSFNVAGEPIVETPDDALWCMLYTGIDCCVLEGQIVTKREGFTSILDLHVGRGRIVLDQASATGATVRIETRYGARIDVVRPETLDILSRIGVPTPGRVLLEQLRRTRSAEGWDETRLVRELGALRRAGIVAFSEGAP